MVSAFNVSTWGQGHTELCEFEVNLVSTKFQASQGYARGPNHKAKYIVVLHPLLYLLRNARESHRLSTCHRTSSVPCWSAPVTALASPQFCSVILSGLPLQTTLDAGSQLCPVPAGNPLFLGGGLHCTFPVQ